MWSWREVRDSRLYPLTRVTNKHLLPVFDRPMVFYPIQTLVDAGIRDIIIVTGGQNSGDFLRLLSNGKDFELRRIHYTYQEGEGGIADALRLAEPFVEGEKICVVLGDNIIENNIASSKEAFRETGERRAHHPERSHRPGAVWLPRIFEREDYWASKRNPKHRNRIMP